MIVSGAADPMRGYRCEVIAEGPVYGKDQWALMVLGTFQTPFVSRALRWLRCQALRIADGLDPAPDATSPLCYSLRPVECAAQLGDAPTDLRNWANSDWSRQSAYDQLRDGEPFVLATADHTGRYSLAAWPVDVPVQADALPTRREQSTNSRSGHLKHRKHRRKAGSLLFR
ncbi:hypothetical protein ABZ769_33340 [Streptomyces olivoreticuli]